MWLKFTQKYVAYTYLLVDIDFECLNDCFLPSCMYVLAFGFQEVFSHRLGFSIMLQMHIIN